MDKCPECGENSLQHTHQEAHGMSGTHMAGSEQYHCRACKFTVNSEEEGKKYDLPFFMDKEKS